MGKKKQNTNNSKNNSGSNNTKTPVPAANPITNYLKPAAHEEHPPKNKETTLLKNLLSKGEPQGTTESNFTPVKEASTSVENKEEVTRNINIIEKEIDSQVRVVSPDSNTSPSNNHRAVSTTLSEEDNLGGLTLSTVSLSTPHSTSVRSPMVQFDDIYPESDELVRDVDCLVPNQTPTALPKDGEHDKSFHFQDTYNEIASPYIARRNEGDDINDEDSLTTEPDKVRLFSFFFSCLFPFPSFFLPG
jgi:hypothetical protein